MSVPAVGIEITARLDDFRAQMAKIPDIGGKEAKALVAQLSREIKAAERAAKKAATETKGAWDSVNDSAGKAGQSAAKLAGALELVSPAAAEAARGMADIADVGEVASEGAKALGLSLGTAATALGVVAAAVGAGYLAWRSYNEDADRAAEIADKVTQAHREMAPILQATRDAQIELALATGDMTEAEAAMLRGGLTAQQAYQQSTANTRKRIAELGGEMGSVSTQIVDATEEMLSYLGPLGPGLSAAFGGITTNAAEVRQEYDALNATLDVAAEETRWLAETTNHVVAAKERDVKVTKEQVKAQREYVESLGFQEAALRASLASRQAARQEELDAARLASEEEGAALMARIEAEQAARAKAAEAATEAEATRAREVADLQATATGEIVGNLADVTAAHKDAGSAAFAFYKAAAVAQIAVDTQKGVMAAIANFTPIPVVGPALAAGAAATIIAAGASAAGTVLAEEPSFGDTPGPMKMERGGRVRLAQDDFFVAAQTPEDLRRQVGGASRADGPTVLRLSHRVLHTSIRENVSLNGPLAKIRNGGATIGHRARD